MPAPELLEGIKQVLGSVQALADIKGTPVKFVSDQAGNLNTMPADQVERNMRALSDVLTNTNNGLRKLLDAATSEPEPDETDIQTISAINVSLKALFDQIEHIISKESAPLAAINGVNANLGQLGSKIDAIASKPTPIQSNTVATDLVLERISEQIGGLQESQLEPHNITMHVTERDKAGDIKTVKVNVVKG